MTWKQRSGTNNGDKNKLLFQQLQKYKNSKQDHIAEIRKIKYISLCEMEL